MRSSARLNDISWIRLLLPQETRILISGLMQILHDTSKPLDAEHRMLGEIAIEEFLDVSRGHRGSGLAAKVPAEATRIVWAALLGFVDGARATEIALDEAELTRARHLFDTLVASSESVEASPQHPARGDTAARNSPCAISRN